MRKLATLARKVAYHVRRRFGSTSGSGGPLPGAAGRAAPGERTVSSETRFEGLRGAGGGSAPGEARAPAQSRAKRGKVAPEPLLGAAGKMESASRAASRLPPLPREAAEGKLKAVVSKNKKMTMARESVAMKSPDGLSASTTSAPSTSTSPPPPPPHVPSDLWFKLMMAGGAAIAFLMDFLRSYVEKEVDLKMKEKLIKDLEVKQQQLVTDLATKEQRPRGWLWW